jgi:transposase-like protein
MTPTYNCPVCKSSNTHYIREKHKTLAILIEEWKCWNCGNVFDKRYTGGTLVFNTDQS